MSPQVYRFFTLFWTLSRPHVPTLKAFLPSFPSLPCREFLGPLNLLALPEAEAAKVAESSRESEIAKFD